MFEDFHLEAEYENRTYVDYPDTYDPDDSTYPWDDPDYEGLLYDED